MQDRQHHQQPVLLDEEDEEDDHPMRPKEMETVIVSVAAAADAVGPPKPDLKVDEETGDLTKNIGGLSGIA